MLKPLVYFTKKMLSLLGLRRLKDGEVKQDSTQHHSRENPTKVKHLD